MARSDVSDVENKAHVHYDPTTWTADTAHSRNRPQRKTKQERNAERHHRSREQKVTAKVLQKEGNLAKQVCLAYNEGLIELHSGQITVHLSVLQRMNLEFLREKVVLHAFKAQYDTDNYNVDHANSDMKNYVDAIQALEYMAKFCRRKPEYDPFFLSTDWTLHRAVLKDFASAVDIDDFENSIELGRVLRPVREHTLPKVVDRYDVKRFGMTRTMTLKELDWEVYRKNVGMAVLGGAFLIGPMLVMVLHPGLITSLVTTSVCVFAFGMVVALFLENPFDVLSGTAAYAAVLVVFIGTSGTSG